MTPDHKSIATLWRKTYSDNISKYDPYKATSQFERIAALFAPGDSYFYVLNLHNLELDYVSPSVHKLTGKDASTVTIEDLLGMALPEEIQKIQKKEQLIDQFFNGYLRPEERTSYRIVYSYRMLDHNGSVRNMLHQATVLSLNEDKTPQHVLSVHSDVSHLNIISTAEVSFLHLENGESFCNLDPEEFPFDPVKARKKKPSLVHHLSDRELEITKLLSRGMETNHIADKLNISKHTVRTHRKNILQKSNCSNTAELITKAVLGGLVV